MGILFIKIPHALIEKEGDNISLDYEEISTVIQEFIRTYVKNSGSKGVVLGLSGGIDSAVTAILCKKALGKKNVKCVFLPDNVTPSSDIRDQALITKKFDLNCKTKDITPLVSEYKKYCILKPKKMALANIKARVRMIILFEYANMNDSIVCGTSNKSEILVGYFTKFGDGGVDIMPIGDLYKTQIYELARFLEIPEKIVSKPPTAGLIKGQTKKKELKMDYYTLDTILMGLEKKLDLGNISKEASVEISEVERIKNLRIKSQHKRRMPMIPKVGLRTPGFDWRSPVQLG